MQFALPMVCWLSLGVLAGESRADEQAPPNVVFILADDIGYGDLGCYGATRVKTPNLDRMAAQGMRFTDAHSPSAMCTPTRYALMTGQYAWRHGPVAKGVLSGVAPLAVPLDRLTLPKLFKQAGYTTGVVGKWHLGLGEGTTDYNRPIKPGPLEIGFDYAFVIPATGDRVPCVYVENHAVVGYDPADPIRVSYKEKVGDEPAGRDHPELLKMKTSHGHDFTIINGISRIGWMSGGKAARWVDEDMADTITARAVSYIEKNQSRPFFLYFATHDVHVPRVPHARFAGSSGCGVRGDVIQELDWCVGQLLGTLDRLGLAERTLVVFTSDNGGVIDDGYADGAEQDLNGHLVNGALRGFKGGLYEGGHRVPFIAQWKGRIAAGTTSDVTICHADMLATAAELTGQTLSRDAGPDSFSIMPCLAGKAEAVRPNLTMHSGGGQVAVRRGPWKLVPRPWAKKAPGGKKASGGKNTNGTGNAGTTPRTAGGGELFNLADDPAETTDVSGEHPEIVRELSALLDELRQSGHSRPY